MMTTPSTVAAATVLLVCCCCCCWLVSAEPRCPATLHYSDCACYEQPFQVKCGPAANFSSLPADLPDCTIMSFEGVRFEVVDAVPYPNLKTLLLNNNSIRVVHPGAFAQLHNVGTLVMSHNPLGEISMATFEGLTSLDFLSLEGTRLYTLPLYTFVGKHLPALEILKLSNASLYSVQVHAFHKLHKLALLNISHNHLRLIPEFSSADNLVNLTHLDLSHNQIEAVGDLQNLHRLQFLFLNNNRIKQVAHRAFLGLDTTLVSVDLAYNGLNYSDPTAFVRLKRLQSLYVSNNALTMLLWEELPWGNLMKLVLHDNPWNCECENSWMVESEFIAVHNNNTNFRCATPKSVAGEPVLSVPISSFECPRRTHAIRTTVIMAVALMGSVLASGLGAFVLCRCFRRRKAGGHETGGIGGGIGGVTSAYKRVHDDQGELILRT